MLKRGTALLSLILSASLLCDTAFGRLPTPRRDTSPLSISRFQEQAFIAPVIHMLHSFGASSWKHKHITATAGVAPLTWVRKLWVWVANDNSPLAEAAV